MRIEIPRALVCAGVVAAAWSAAWSAACRPAVTDAPAGGALPPAQVELVAAERAFAALGAERGVRESFVAWFADDGIGFAPHPYKVKETLLKSAPREGPAPTVLRWAPVYGDIAASGEMGWNTGPTLVEAVPPNDAPPSHGIFFSVWKRQAAGPWRVVLDLGGDTPAPVAPLDAPFVTVHRTRPDLAGGAAAASPDGGLLEAERDFLSEAARGAGQAYRARLREEARIHRHGAMPVVGRAALDAWLDAQSAATMSGEPAAADVARSGELGYTYGRYETGGGDRRSGYFARVWKRDPGGPWRIAVDVDSPVPPGSAPAAAASGP